LHSSGIVSNIDTGFIFESITEEINNNIIKIFTTEMGITISRFYFKDTIAKFKNRNIKGTTTKIKDNDLFLILLF